MIKVIAVLCTLAQPSVCHDQIAHEADSMKVCQDQASLVKWWEESGYGPRGYRLAGWRCQIGQKARAA